MATSIIALGMIDDRLGGRNLGQRMRSGTEPVDQCRAPRANVGGAGWCAGSELDRLRRQDGGRKRPAGAGIRNPDMPQAEQRTWSHGDLDRYQTAPAIGFGSSRNARWRRLVET